MNKFKKLQDLYLETRNLKEVQKSLQLDLVEIEKDNNNTSHISLSSILRKLSTERAGKLSRLIMSYIKCEMFELELHINGLIDKEIIQ